MKLGPSPDRARSAAARRLVHGQDVAAVHACARHPVAGRLVGQRLRGRLRRERRRDRPLVVVAEEDRGRLHHAGKFAPSWNSLRTSRRRRSTRSQPPARRAASSPRPGPSRAGRGSRSGRRSRRRCSRAGSTSRRDGRATTRTVETGIPRRRPIAGLAVAQEDPVAALERGITNRPASPRGSRRSRRCRSGPGGGRRPTVRRRFGRHHRAVELDQVALVEPLDLPVRDALAVADDAAQFALVGQDMRHGTANLPRRCSGSAAAEREDSRRESAQPPPHPAPRGQAHRRRRSAPPRRGQRRSRSGRDEAGQKSGAPGGDSAGHRTAQPCLERRELPHSEQPGCEERRACGVAAVRERRSRRGAECEQHPRNDDRPPAPEAGRKHGCRARGGPRPAAEAPRPSRPARPQRQRTARPPAP